MKIRITVENEDDLAQVHQWTVETNAPLDWITDLIHEQVEAGVQTAKFVEFVLETGMELFGKKETK